MRNFIKLLSSTAIIAGAMFVMSTEADAQKRTAPQGERFYVGKARVVAQPAIRKTGPTMVPIVDSNAILNLDYSELRSAPAAVAKPKPVAPVAAPKEPTLPEMKLQLRAAEDNLKAAKLTHTQAVRSKDKTRVEEATRNRDAAAKEVVKLKKAIAAKEPAKAPQRKAPKKSTPGTKRTATAPAETK